jgi:hypothetical protein
MLAAGEEPMAQCGRPQRRAPAVLWHHGGKLLHGALRSVPLHRNPVSGIPPPPPSYTILTFINMIVSSVSFSCVNGSMGTL